MRADDPILQECRSALEALYGQRLKGIILYGSAARGTETEESDIDLLVLLEGPMEIGKELFRICHVLYQIELDTDRLISPMPADVDEYQGGPVPPVPQRPPRGCCRVTQYLNESLW